MKRHAVGVLLIAVVAFACGTQGNTSDSEPGAGKQPATATDRYIIFLNQEVFPSFSHPSQQTQYRDREEQARAAMAYEARMSEKVRQFAVEKLGLTSGQIVNIMAAGFTAIVADLTPAQVAQVDKWPDRFDEVESVQRDFEVGIDPGEVIIVDPDTLR